ncbi:hypothetical protein L7F22_061639 [Adiantum nelumboides]|nr:hypothetical protein [Adiantum nelumboides]
MADVDKRGIGHAHAVFYEAYLACLEAKRRFGDANIVYKRGVASQDHPIEKLAKSYKIFRDRIYARNMRKQGQIEHRYSHLDEEGSHRYSHIDNDGIRHTKVCQGGAKLASRSHLIATILYTSEGLYIIFEEARLANACKMVNSNAREQPEANLPSSLKRVTSLSISGKLGSTSFGEDTIQIKFFVAEVITGKKKDVEDAGHHGLVDPTLNTEEALQDILSMFLKPVDIAKKDINKPSKRLVSVTASTSPPLFQGKRSEVASPKGGNHRVQPLEIAVFKDDEQE